MNFRDRPATCTSCGKTFIFTVTEQRQLHDAGQIAFEPDTNEIAAPASCPSCRLRDPATGRWSGRVKWFSSENGYGFIVKPNGEEIFFHRSQIMDEPPVALEEGALVSFELVSTDRGEEAKQVKLEAA
jgi:CspA family cold shock protein